ncbi:repressed by EFG1 protein 1-like [Carcharodon carcharias]|uniref:repressed by EFG1 protein 1-like n=1 Tax=Carcharodon carcharias TaxID=13397 RepID=UPI001B7EB550|nr:repressed by EFG1 protein 1-like [Carcharodon carcharias]
MCCLISGKDPVVAWYNEISDYDFSSPGFSTLTGQFTQMLWLATTHFGIAFAKSDKGIYVVAQYSPAGNIVDQHSFQTNVLPPDSLSLDLKDKQDSGSQQTSSEDSTADLSAFEKEALAAHNTYRARHNTAPLSLNKELSKDCRVWANVLTQDGVIAQSPTNFGENIWSNPSITEGEISGKEPVDAWYAEMKYYDYEKPGLSEKTEHFTQMMWKETTDMGIAYVVSDKGAFVVAQYKPRGNATKVETFVKNVLPLDAAYSEPLFKAEAPEGEAMPAPAGSPPEKTYAAYSYFPKNIPCL